MMRRLINTECRKVCELQHTHKQCTAARKVAKRTGEAECKRDRGLGFSPDGDTTQLTHTQKITKYSGNAKRSGEEGLGEGGFWLLLQCNTTRLHREATTRAT